MLDNNASKVSLYSGLFNRTVLVLVYQSTEFRRFIGYVNQIFVQS